MIYLYFYMLWSYARLKSKVAVKVPFEFWHAFPLLYGTNILSIGILKMKKFEFKEISLKFKIQWPICDR